MAAVHTDRGGKYAFPLLRLNRFCPEGLMCHVESGQVKSLPCQVGTSTRVNFMSSSSQNPTRARSYLSLTLVLGQVDLFQHLWPLFHYQGLLVSVGWDITVMLRREKWDRFFFSPAVVWLEFVVSTREAFSKMVTHWLSSHINVAFYVQFSAVICRLLFTEIIFNSIPTSQFANLKQ